MTIRCSAPVSAACPSIYKQKHCPLLTCISVLQRPWLPNADEDVVDSLCIMMSKACLSCELPQVSQQELRAAPILNILDNKEVCIVPYYFVCTLLLWTVTMPDA